MVIIPVCLAGCGGGGGGGGGDSIPVAPTGLSVIVTAETSVTVGWADASSNETGFEVQLRTGTAAFATVGSTGAGATQYTANGLTTGVSYDLRVRALGSAGNSAWAGPVSGVPSTGGGTTGTVSGRVVSLLGGVPIVGGQITVGTKSTNSGVDGIFTLINVPLGNQPLTVTATNYNPVNTTIVVDAGVNDVGDIHLTGVGDGPPPPPIL